MFLIDKAELLQIKSMLIMSGKRIKMQILFKDL